MRHRRIEVVLPLLLLAGGCGGVEWETYHSDEGRFSVRMPDDPESEHYDAATPAGSMPVHTVSAEHDSVLYLVVWLDLPPYLADSAAPESFLDQAEQWGANPGEGTLLRDTAVALGEHAGRDFTFRRPDGLLQRLRLHMAGNRLYQVVASGPAERIAGKGTDRFFDSFAIEE